VERHTHIPHRGDGTGPPDGFDRPLTSRVRLPYLAVRPVTVVDYLTARFPHVSAAAWTSRCLGNRVAFDDGTRVRPDTPYLPGRTVLYRREVPNEDDAPEPEIILWEGDDLIVADKPHGMPVTPAGLYVQRSLLVRLQEGANSTDIVPAHRLDRETAGVVLFIKNATKRAAYHQIFATGCVEREYLALARADASVTQTRWRVENRIGPSTPWFRQQVVEGRPNAVSEIELIRRTEDIGLFRIRPQTGRKHQIRVHMSVIGFPILGDPLYPEPTERTSRQLPLQLLARSLSFTDPLSGVGRAFRSGRALAAWG